MPHFPYIYDICLPVPRPNLLKRLLSVYSLHSGKGHFPSINATGQLALLHVHRLNYDVQLVLIVPSEWMKLGVLPIFPATVQLQALSNSSGSVNESFSLISLSS